MNPRPLLGRKQDLGSKRLFQADGRLLCQSDLEATDAGLRPVETEIAKDAGRRRPVGVAPGEVLSEVKGLGGWVLPLEVRSARRCQ